MDDRNVILLGALDRASRLIEIGPSFAPVAAKADGWSTIVVDHAARDELVAKYDGHPYVDVGRIEDVDVVWTGGALHEAFPSGASGVYDGVIASHVIEHVPDPVGFLRSAAELLRPDGVVVLAVPDKRLCFDCVRPTSTTGQVLAAHRASRSRLSDAALFDAIAYDARPLDRAPSWGRTAVGELPPTQSLEEAATAIADYTGAPESRYVDGHAWVFTPASFALLILELGALGIIDWRIETLAERPQTEFLVRLVRGRERFATPATREAQRAKLLRRMLFEIREQTDWLLGAGAGAPASPPEAGVTQERLERMEAILLEVAATGAMARKALRPARFVWRRLLPLRRVVARVRGRTC